MTKEQNSAGASGGAASVGGGGGRGMCAKCGGTYGYIPGMRMCRYKAYDCKD